MIPDDTKKLFLTKFSNFGSEKFYKFLLNYGVNKIITFAELKKNKSEQGNISPELELLDYHDKFVILFRRENDNSYLEMAKLFRKAAHKIYVIMLKKDMIVKNNRFLNLVG